MADHGEVEYASASGNDHAAHEAMYRTFLGLVKWHIIVIIFIVVMMAIFLT